MFDGSPNIFAVVHPERVAAMFDEDTAIRELVASAHVFSRAFTLASMGGGHR